MSDVTLHLSAISQHLAELRDAERQRRIEQQREQELLRGIKFIRLPLVRQAGANPFTAGGDIGGVDASPNVGFTWMLRHLVIEGLTAGATPDVVNILRGARIIWQLNGNQFAQTWGRGEMWLNAGETLAYQSVGTFTSTAQIIIHGTAEEVPGPMLGKLK